tara:strand:+ start:1232 stop:2335 length:1104 start_codon:yes stop_codon:yes gene_type:complete
MNTHAQRIVHLVTTFNCGGLEQVILNLIKHTPAELNVEHIVVSLTNEMEMAEHLPAGVQCLSLNKQPGKDPKVHLNLFKLLKKLKPHAFHTYNFGTIEYHPIAKLAGVKVSVHADHGLGGDHPEGKNKLHNVVRKVASFFIDEYVVVSDNLKEWVINTVGVNPKKVDFVFNGVVVHPHSPEQKKEFTDDQPFKLLNVGRAAEVKNQASLLRALSSALKQQPEMSIHLTIVGDGPEFNNLVSLRDELHLNDVVSLPGLQFDVDKRMSACDGFVLSSKYEAMPMTVLEAMSSTRPVICPMVGGVCDFISREDAMLIEGNSESALTEAIIHLYNMPSEEREAMATRGYQSVFNLYSVENMVSAYMKKYRI